VTGNTTISHASSAAAAILANDWRPLAEVVAPPAHVIAYQPAEFREDFHASPRPKRIRRIFLSAAALVLLVICFAIYWTVTEIRSHRRQVTLVVTNSTRSPIDQAGWVNPMQDWVVPVGPIQPGQTVQVMKEYSDDENPDGFAFLQHDKLLRVDFFTTGYDIIENPDGSLTDRYTRAVFKSVDPGPATRP
jgi:hypothetical protein